LNAFLKTINSLLLGVLNYKTSQLYQSLKTRQFTLVDEMLKTQLTDFPVFV